MFIRSKKSVKIGAAPKLRMEQPLRGRAAAFKEGGGAWHPIVVHGRTPYSG